MKVERSRKITYTAIFVALIIIGAFIRIPVPVVPFTMQFLFTNLAGLILGKKLGFTSVAIYILLGIIGIPIFANGGGFSYIFQPTFGYILGFTIGTFIAGYISEKYKKTWKNLLIASFLNLLIVYACGMIYCFCISKFYLNSPIAIGTLFITGFLACLPGDTISVILSVFLTKRLYPVLFREIKKEN